MGTIVRLDLDMETQNPRLPLSVKLDGWTRSPIMKRIILGAIFLLAIFTKPASAGQTQLLVQANLSAPTMNLVCQFEGCQVTYSFNGSSSNYFVLSTSANPSFLITVLQNIYGVLSVNVISGGQNPIGNHYIVHTTNGLAGLQPLCLLNLCQILEPLDGGLNQVFLVAGPNNQDPNLFLSLLQSLPGVVNAELDQVVTVATGGAAATDPPPSLVDTTPVQYYGSTVWEGYVNQPAAQIINLSQAQQTYSLTGSGIIIADIDTGVDPNHPVLQPVLLPGYDFTRNQPGGSEMNDLPGGAPTTETPCTGCTPGQVNQHSIAMVDQHSIAMVDGSGYQDFGHGTMVAGLLHLVAPTAQLMPLKSFGADGSGNLSDIVRAIYYATQNNVNVINMSFDLQTPSQELAATVNFAERQGLLVAASAGNDGQMEMVYPAGYSNVMGVASTDNEDQRSTFSNYGDQIVWVAAPGEAMITTYPFGTYAAGWGTSFSAPLVSGGVAIIMGSQPGLTESQAQFDLGQARPLVTVGMGAGRIDLYRATSAAQLPIF
jgi:subtilisin family serine protease